MKNNDKISEMIRAMNYNKFIILDTESTGFSTNGNYPDELTEIGAIKVIDGQIVGRFSKLIKPFNHQLNKGSAVNVTGITDEMVADCDGYPKVLAEFATFCSGDFVLIMHNAPHDLRFLNFWGHKIGIQFEQPYIDTLDLAKNIVDQGWLMEKEMKSKTSHKLQELAAAYEIPDPSHHRAENDAEVTWKVFVKIRDNYFKLNPEQRKPYHYVSCGSNEEIKEALAKQQKINIVNVCPWQKYGYYRIYVDICKGELDEGNVAKVFYDFTKKFLVFKREQLPDYRFF